MPPFNDRRVARTKAVTPAQLRAGDYMKTERGFEQVKELEFEPDSSLHGYEDPYKGERGAHRNHGVMGDLTDETGTWHVWTHQGYETLRHDDTVERTSRGRNRRPYKPGRMS